MIQVSELNYCYSVRLVFFSKQSKARLHDVIDEQPPIFNSIAPLALLCQANLTQHFTSILGCHPCQLTVLYNTTNYHSIYSSVVSLSQVVSLPCTIAEAVIWFFEISNSNFRLYR